MQKLKSPSFSVTSFSARSFTAVAALALVAALAGCAQPGTPSAAAAQPAAAQLAVQRVALAQGLYELAYSEKQNAVFVASAGGFGPTAVAPKVLRLNPQTLAVEAEIAVERKGFGVVLDDAANRLYIGNTTDASITVIDTGTNKVTAVIQLAEKVKDAAGKERYPHSVREMVLDTANNRLYAPGLATENSALYVVDTRALKLEKVLTGFGYVATGIAFDKAGQRVFVSNLQGQVRTIDTRTLTVQKVDEVEGDQLLNLAYAARTGSILATDQGLPSINETRKKAVADYRVRGAGNRVVVLDANTRKQTASIPTGDGPITLLLDEERARLYVTNRGAGTVTVFDSTTNKLLNTVTLPAHPNSLALDTKRNVLYVSIKNGAQEPKGASESIARIAF